MLISNFSNTLINYGQFDMRVILEIKILGDKFLCHFVNKSNL